MIRQDNLEAIRRGKYRTTTDLRHDYPVAPNLLGRDYQAMQRDRVYVADISYIPTYENRL